MNCPSCLSIMENRDERHHVHPDSYRMNLHCCNFDHSKKQFVTPGCLPCHFGVIVPPAYSNQEWICDHYNLSFKYFDNWFILRATPSTPNIEFNAITNKWELVFHPLSKWTEVLSSFDKSPIIKVPFIPISTNNDMHIQAGKIFKSLTKLLIFS